MTKAADLAAGEYSAGILFQAYGDDVARAYLSLCRTPLARISDTGAEGRGSVQNELPAHQATPMPPPLTLTETHTAHASLHDYAVRLNVIFLTGTICLP